MKKVTVNLSNPYEVQIERNILRDIGVRMRSVTKAVKVLAVTDTNVAPLYLDGVKKSLESAGFRAYEYVFSAGESSKTATTYLDIIDKLAREGFKRTDAVLALGGGVVGDIAGFAAATYMRGIDVVQAPTTLLAMIDSSIGGKTGVDLAYGKNLLGAFHQPKLVIADPNTLDTLPDGEWKNGLGEGVKYACLAGGRIAEIMSGGSIERDLEEFISLCAKYKADIVAADEKEGGMRKLLNLGHTVGHAVERLSGFSVPHGVAVATGIYVMAKAARYHGELQKHEFDIIKNMLSRIGVYGETVLSGDCIDAIALDKKSEGSNEISVIKIRSIGNCFTEKTTLKEFADYIGRMA